MTEESMANAFNTWMKLYLENPSEGDKQFKEQQEEFKADITAGRIPIYGSKCVESLKEYGAK